MLKSLAIFSLILSSSFRSVYANEYSIVGTWSSKSNTVFTGPGFYDPIDELLLEPDLPGISYSFTEDGFWEEALYIVTSNPQEPKCPTAVLIYQHGVYETLSNGSLSLLAFEVDGRQLLSDPCGDTTDESVYSRYSQNELMKDYQVSVDSYHGRYKLQLYEWDGNPKQPMYLAYKPPMMLPTKVMNPTDTSDESKASKLIKSKSTIAASNVIDDDTSAAATTAADAATTSTTAAAVKRMSLRQRVRRSLENRGRTRAIKNTARQYDALWWVSVGLIAIGSACWISS